MSAKKYEPVRVRTITAESPLTGQPYAEPFTESEKLINWHDSSDRKWLTNHMHWALLNGREIRLLALHKSALA